MTGSSLSATGAELTTIRPVVLLSTAAFVSSASMRVADPLIPQISVEMGVTPGEAAVIVTAFAIAYGLCQLLYGPLGDRFGKYRLVAIMATISAVTVAWPGITHSLQGLGLARLLSGATAAALIPLGMAFIGDHVPYERRQTALARFLIGGTMGLLTGQVLGGLLGELLGWRAVFLVLGGLFSLVAALLWLELRRGALPPPRLVPPAGPARLLANYLDVASRPWPRIVLLTVAVEGGLFFGGFAYVGALIHARFDLGYALIGLLLAGLGIGGLAYALSVRRLVARLGETGLARTGGSLIAAGFTVIALAPAPLLILPGTMLAGLGFNMLHNTLQTNATQMAPESRGLALALFASSLFLGQALGVWLYGRAGDLWGYQPLLPLVGIALLALGFTFARLLRLRPGHAG